METAADALGKGVNEHGVGGPMGKTDNAELSDKSATEREEGDEHSGEESDEKREDGDHAEREEDGGCVKAAARWVFCMVGLGAALVAYAAARARYQPLDGGALQRDCLMVDDASTRAIPDAHPYCTFSCPLHASAVLKMLLLLLPYVDYWIRIYY